MSLRPQPCPEVPSSTAAIARAAFPRGNPCLRLRDALGTVFSDAQFAPLFPSRGTMLIVFVALVWRAERARLPVQAFVPLRFDPGEAYQFDWSHEGIEFNGLPLTVKVAQMRLTYRRMPFVRAYFRETQEMVFDA